MDAEKIGMVRKKLFNWEIRLMSKTTSIDKRKSKVRKQINKAGRSWIVHTYKCGCPEANYFDLAIAHHLRFEHRVPG